MPDINEEKLFWIDGSQAGNLTKRIWLEHGIPLVTFGKSRKLKDATAFAFYDTEEFRKILDECRAEIRESKHKEAKRDSENAVDGEENE